MGGCRSGRPRHAALFAGSTVWAVQHDPSPAPAPALATISAGSVDPARTAPLRTRLAAEHRAMHALQTRLRHLLARTDLFTALVAGSESAAPAPSGPSSTSRRSTSSVRPPAAVAPRPKPAPPTQGSTGASGAH